MAEGTELECIDTLGLFSSAEKAARELVRIWVECETTVIGRRARGRGDRRPSGSDALRRAKASVAKAMAALRAATTATYGTADRREDCILLATAIYVSANEAYEAKVVQERAERISGRTPAKFGDYSGLREAHEEARGMVNPGAAPRRGPAVVLCRELRDSATGNLVQSQFNGSTGLHWRC